jgi:DNA-binding response OmpR family regulator
MTNQLAGKRILIVEDEQMIAEYLAYEMNAEGAEVIGPVASINAALDVIANTGLDAVTLDIKLIGEKAFPVADVLSARNIPFVFLTGYGANDVPARHANVSRVEKPVTPAVICRVLEATLAVRSKDTSPARHHHWRFRRSLSPRALAPAARRAAGFLLTTAERLSAVVHRHG